MGQPEIHRRQEVGLLHDPALSPEPEAHAQVLYGRLHECFDAAALHLARLMASKDDAHLLGDTEFRVRERVPDRGAQVLHLAPEQRNKGATKVPAPTAPAAGKRHAASGAATKPSRRGSAWCACSGITIAVRTVAKASARGMPFFI